MSYRVRCHHCSAFCGEASEPLKFVGMFERAKDANVVALPRETWRCGSCGWVNVFRRASWRDVETKRLTPAVAGQ